jgi:hypothetical protein
MVFHYESMIIIIIIILLTLLYSSLEVDFVGWSYQVRMYPGIELSLVPAIRLVMTGDVAPLDSVEADIAFGNFDRSELLDLAQHLKKDVDASGSFVHVLVELIALVKGISLLDAIAIACQRFEKHTYDDLLDIVLQIDEGAEVLEPNDAKKLEVHCNTLRTRRTARQAFADDFKEVQQKLRKDAAPKPKGRGKGSHAAGAGAVEGKKKVPDLLSKVVLADWKALYPHGGVLWRSTAKMAWFGRCGKLPEASFAWHRYTESGAILRALSHAWHGWCLIHSKNFEDIPVEGLLKPHELRD